ncbi:hypothetical protein Emag_005187 [Eimeria magna]
MAGDMSQLSLAAGPSQNMALEGGIEKAPDSVRLLNASTEGAAMPRQARNRVFHRTLLGAATSYVAMLAVALLILVCARRLSNLSVDEGRVRSLASGERAERAGVCGGNAEGGGEEAIYEETGASHKAIMQQAEKNIRGFRRMISDLVALKTGHYYKAVATATSVYLLVLSEMGLLGAFIDEELVRVRQLWLSTMKQAVDSAHRLGTGRSAAGTALALRDIHGINGDLLELVETMLTKKRKGKRLGETNRWIVLHNVVRVQAVAVDIACDCLSVLHPASEFRAKARRRALSTIGILSDTRRRMVLANPSYAFYFRGFFLRGFARKRFGTWAAQDARGGDLPLSPQDQINYLRDLPKDPEAGPQEAAAPLSSPSPPDTDSSSEEEEALPPPQGPPEQPLKSPIQSAEPPEPVQASTMQLQGAPMQLSGPPQSPQGPLVQPPGPPLQPAGPPSASGPGVEGPYYFEQLGARPRTYLEGAATGGEESSVVSLEKSSSGIPYFVQLPAGKPGGPTGAGPPFASSADTHMKNLPGSGPGILAQAPQTSLTAMHEGTPLSLGKEPKVENLALTNAVPSGKGGALPWFGAESEERAAEEARAPTDELARALSALALAEKERATADVGAEVEEEIEPSDGSAMHARQPTHGRLPAEELAPFSSTPWAAPGTPVGPHMPSVRSSSSARSNAFFGVPQGAPRPLNPKPSGPPGFWRPPRFAGPVRHVLQSLSGPPGGAHGVPGPPIPMPSVPPRFLGPPRFSGPVSHLLQRPPEPLELPLENPPVPPFRGPSPPHGFTEPVRQSLQRAAGPPGGPPGVPRPPILSPSWPPGSTGPSLLGEAVRQALQRPALPFGPPPPAGGSQAFGSLLGTMQHSLSNVLSPSSLSAPSSRGLLPSPSQPIIGGPALLSTLQPSVRGSPAVSTLAPSVLEALPPLPFQPIVIEPSSLGHQAPAVSGRPALEPSPTQEKPLSSILDAFHGAPTGKTESSVGTSVSTALHPAAIYLRFLKGASALKPPASSQLSAITLRDDWEEKPGT